jgi:hypothetical protein
LVLASPLPREFGEREREREREREMRGERGVWGEEEEVEAGRLPRR